jgi:hypothetical protein
MTAKAVAPFCGRRPATAACSALTAHSHARPFKTCEKRRKPETVAGRRPLRLMPQHFELIVIGTGTAASTVEALKQTMLAYPTGASDIGYML